MSTEGDAISRLESMAQDEGETWDLSRNDQDAIRRVLSDLASLRARLEAAEEIIEENERRLIVAKERLEEAEAEVARQGSVIAGTAYPSDSTLTREQAFHGWEVANRQRDAYAQRAIAAEKRAEDAEAWQLAVADGLGSVNRAEGQDGYEVAGADVIVAVFRVAEARAERFREALREVKRRAGLPVNANVNGMPSDEATLRAAIEKCVRLVVEHVTEHARAALAGEETP